jgi:hypothetical protein
VTNSTQMPTRSVFPTFCHISEFRAQGYPRLDTMICLSSPLTLWSPSLSFVQQYKNDQIDADQLCRLVERGVVRIAARQDWIENGERRQQLAKIEFTGAEWTEYDARILDIAKKDAGKEPSAARVQIARKEDGYDVADTFLARRPEAVDNICRLVKEKKVPAGTLERIEIRALTGPQAAREVLRDARNHGRAIKDTGSELPFLSIEYGEFIKLIGEVDEPIAVATTERNRRSAKEVARQTMDLLDNLASMQQPNLEAFAGSAAHKQLAGWMAQRADDARGKDVSDIESLILRSLKSDVDDHFPSLSVLELPAIKADAELVKLLAEIIALLAFALNPRDPWHITGAAFVALRLAHRLLIAFDFAGPHYEGMNWPFLYAFGHRPRGRDLEAFQAYLQRRLNRLGQS